KGIPTVGNSSSEPSAKAGNATRHDTARITRTERHGTFASVSEGQFGKYELLGRLAAGGMAEIFRARFSAAAGISKNVVIKRILPHYAANKQFISMFTNEARIVMGLSHGNIAQVFDFGEIDGDWFIAMEYVDG